MKIDLSTKIDKEIFEMIGLSTKTIKQDLNKAGHIGTHFDVMDKKFSIDNAITKGRVFDISGLNHEKVMPEDIDLNSVQPHEFIMFYTGILKKYGYGTKEYFSTYIELSDELVEALIEKNINFIGVDMAGAKKPADHPRVDQYCADHGIFIIENLNHLDLLLKETNGNPFTAYTFPVNMEGFTGLPCRIIAEAS